MGARKCWWRQGGRCVIEHANHGRLREMMVDSKTAWRGGIFISYMIMSTLDRRLWTAIVTRWTIGRRNGIQDGYSLHLDDHGFYNIIGICG